MVPGIEASGLAGRLAADLRALDAELAEIDLLVAQASAEAERHEQKRAAAAERLAAAQAAAEPTAALLEQATALVALTRRAAVMEAQVEVLAGKRKVLGRYRDALAGYQGAAGEDADGGAAASGTADHDAAAGRSPASSKAVRAAQEELRREIARTMHDGPAQSLTNIVLQAQIVERIVDRDPAVARSEVRQLIDMVQRTLDATKSFIFEVRPMVLDDLGLVPTLRGAARDRRCRTGVTIAFDSFGSDRRLPTDVESGLFRLFDDVLAAYLALAPAQVALRLDWGEQLEARITASGAGGAAGVAPDADGAEPTGLPALPVAEAPPARAPEASRRRGGRGRDDVEIEDELPPALAEMIAQRRDDEQAARAMAAQPRHVVLPDAAFEDLRSRAESLGLHAALLDGGSTVQMTADITALASMGAPA